MPPGRSDSRARGTLLMAALAAGWLGVLAGIAIHQPLWGDEVHYVATVRTFGRDLSLETLRTYPGEMAPPLPFGVYAGWGWLVGFELARLRVLSLLIAFATVMAVHALGRRVLHDEGGAMVAALFFLLHPYTVGLSVFVFNDMMAILFAVLLALGVVTRRPRLIALSSAAGLMARQYLAFLTAAAAVYHAVRWARDRRSYDLAVLGGLAISCLPLVAMFALWHGLGPASTTRDLYLTGHLSFHPASLVLYVTQLFTYLWPLLLWRPAWWAAHSPRWWGCVGAASILYWLAPVRPAPPQVAVGTDTVGFLHRAVRATVGRLGSSAPDVFFWLAFGLGVAVLAAIARDVTLRRPARWPDARTFLGLAVLSFLAVMPFSYMHWEKYFMPVLPLVSVLVLAEGAEDAAGAEV